MALTRARVVAASSPEFKAELTDVVRRAVLQPRPDLDMPADIADMLARVKKEKPPKGPWDIKAIDGGLRDLEFIVQSAYLRARDKLPPQPLTSTLDMIGFAKGTENLKPKLHGKLIAANDFFHALRQAFALTQDGGHKSQSPKLLDTIARLSGVENAKYLERNLKRHCKEVSAQVSSHIT